MSHISKNGSFVKKYQIGWNLPTESIDSVAYDIILVLNENKDEYIEINTLIRDIEKNLNIICLFIKIIEKV